MKIEEIWTNYDQVSIHNFFLNQPTCPTTNAYTSTILNFGNLQLKDKIQFFMLIFSRAS